MGSTVESASTPTATLPPVAADAGPGPVDARANGRELVSQATDPRTGHLDTQAMAGWVADAGRQDPALATEAQAAIESQLVAQGRIGDLSRFNQDVRAAAAMPADGSHGVPGMLVVAGSQAVREGAAMMTRGASMTEAGTRLLVDNPILTKRWEATTSAWTRNGGFTEPLRRVLDAEGIEVARQVNASPAGSIGRNQGVPAAVANNVNGAAARDAIAQRHTLSGDTVRTEVPTHNGQRVVDVRADRPAADPRLSERVEIESKSGRTGSNATTRAQAAHDGAALRNNRALRQGGEALEEAGQALSRNGRVLSTVGRIARPVGVALSVLEVGQSFRADGNRVGEQTGRSVSGVVGGGLGAWGGAAAGAAIGSVVPGVGTLVGGVVGGIIGGLGGDALARGAFDAVKSWF